MEAHLRLPVYPLLLLLCPLHPHLKAHLPHRLATWQEEGQVEGQGEELLDEGREVEG